jgi:hypothetical protein
MDSANCSPRHSQETIVAYSCTHSSHTTSYLTCRTVVIACALTTGATLKVYAATLAVSHCINLHKKSEH